MNRRQFLLSTVAVTGAAVLPAFAKPEPDIESVTYFLMGNPRLDDNDGWLVDRGECVASFMTGGTCVGKISVSAGTTFYSETSDRDQWDVQRRAWPRTNFPLLEDAEELAHWGANPAGVNRG